MIKKIKLTIEGMHCAACGANVTKSLSKLGAKNTNVNVIFGKVFAEIDDKVTEEQLKKAVKEVGFSVKEIEFE